MSIRNFTILVTIIDVEIQACEKFYSIGYWMGPYLNTSGREAGLRLGVVRKLKVPGAGQRVHQVRLLSDHRIENVLKRKGCSHDESLKSL